jgi:hypothetical protein
VVPGDRDDHRSGYVYNDTGAKWMAENGLWTG